MLQGVMSSRSREVATEVAEGAIKNAVFVCTVTLEIRASALLILTMENVRHKRGDKEACSAWVSKLGYVPVHTDHTFRWRLEKTGKLDHTVKTRLYLECI